MPKALPRPLFRVVACLVACVLAVAFAQTPNPKQVKPAPAPVVVKLTASNVVATQNNRVIWQSPVPAGTKALWVEGDTVLVGEGSTVTKRQASTGKVQTRAYLSGRVESLERQSDDFKANVRFPDGITESFTITKDFVVLERVVFPPDELLLHSVETVARAGIPGDALQPLDPVLAETRLRPLAQKDPSNPFLTLFLGAALERQGRLQEAFDAYNNACKTSAPFFVGLRVASLLERLGQPALADKALLQAKQSYATYGYDPGFLVARGALQRWGDPLGTARRLFANDDALRGAAWMGFLRGTMPRFQGSEAVFAEYAAWLETQGRFGEASDWHDFVGTLKIGTPLGLGQRSLVWIETAGMYAVAVFLVAFLVFHAVLFAKYWFVQGQDLKSIGGRFGSWRKAPLTRLRHVGGAYFGFTEKLGALLLLGATVVALTIWNWAGLAVSQLRSEGLQSGTLGGARFWAKEALGLQGPAASLVQGLAAQLDGQSETARKTYENLSQNAPAINNLGVLAAQKGDLAGANTRYREALTLDAKQLAAAYNLGLGRGGERSDFQSAFRANQPMLELPNTLQYAQAVAGGFEDQMTRFYQQPLAYVVALPWIAPAWAKLLVALVFLLVLVLSVVALVVPRVRGARTAPKNWVYWLVALLVPGGPIVAEVWALLMLVPWVALCGALLLALWPGLAPGLTGSTTQLGIAQLPALLEPRTILVAASVGLLVLYAINVVSWVVVFAHNRRASKTP